MAILREWRAEIRRALKQEYVDYVTATGIAEYRRAEGNLGAVIATRDLDSERSEIVTLSWWKNEASIQAFAGDEISRSRYYPQDHRYLLTYPETVQHYEATDPCQEGA
jgi:heme-degrading monooxygenase HmoA